MLALSRRETKFTISNEEIPPVSKKITYMRAITLHIVGTKTELPQFGLAVRQPPFCCVLFLTLLFAIGAVTLLGVLSWRFFIKNSPKTEHRLQKYNSIELKVRYG